MARSPSMPGEDEGFLVSRWVVLFLFFFGRICLLLAHCIFKLLDLSSVLLHYKPTFHMKFSLGKLSYAVVVSLC